MTFFRNSKIGRRPPPANADAWPYQSVLDAVNDGWRIVSFPNMALLALSADDPHGLGFEFYLGKVALRMEDEKTFDCAATLTDTEVLDFCKNGYLLLEGVVPKEVNRRSIEYCGQDDDEPTGILQNWFHEGVICNSAAAARTDEQPPRRSAFRRSRLARRGNSTFGPELNYLQVFYYPQDTPVKMGPDRGSARLAPRQEQGPLYGPPHRDPRRCRHHRPRRLYFITAYQIWHRRGETTGTGMRNLLKYFYWRTQPSSRDWIVEDNFDFTTVNYGSPIAAIVEQFRADIKVAEISLWLCGRHDAFQNLGGQSWPLAGPSQRLALRPALPIFNPLALPPAPPCSIVA